MSMKEQRKLLKKTGRTIKNLSDCQVHHAFVNAMLSKNDLSVCVDQHLDKKFKKEMPEFFNIDKALFLKTWAKAYKEGEIEGLLWVAAVRPDLTCEDNLSIFEDVHMLMHINAEQNRKQRRQFCFQQKENEKLAQKAAKTRGAIKALKKENAGALNKCALLEKEKKNLEDELLKLRRIMEEPGKEFGGDAKNSKLKDDLQGLAKEITDCRQRIKALEEQNNRLNSKLARQREINTGLREETEKVVSQISLLNRCDENCPSFDLCRKRILIVGGITKIESLYRKLIEENGGIFEYHDGYMSGGVKMLENRLKRSDVVFCPVDCNSHVACLTVKKLGKKHKKDVRMLAGSGLSTISHALSECGKDVACAIRN